MRQVSKYVKHVDVTGMFIGIYLVDHQPVVVSLEDTLFLPIFSTPEKYDEAMAIAGSGRNTKIQVIENHTEFMASLPSTLRLMLDPWATEEGNTRFIELFNQNNLSDESMN